MADNAGFDFELETDSLADSLGRYLPRRSLYVVSGAIGAGKSLISQRLAYGLIAHGARLTMVTTELTTRGWLEQVESLGYPLNEAADTGQFTLLSRFGVVSDEVDAHIGIDAILGSEARENADI